MMNHKKEPLAMFNDLAMVQDRRLELLRAFYLLSVNELEDSLSLFINYATDLFERGGLVLWYPASCRVRFHFWPNGNFHL